MVLLAVVSLLGCGGSADSLPNLAFGGDHTGLFEAPHSVDCRIIRDLDGFEFVRIDWVLEPEPDRNGLLMDLPMPPQDHLRRAAQGVASLTVPPISGIETYVTLAAGDDVPLREGSTDGPFVPVWLHLLRIPEPGYESLLTDTTVYCEDDR